MLYSIGEKVYVNKTHYSNYVGMGTVEGICKDLSDLTKFFHEEHPFYSTYLSWLQNNKIIYVVNLEQNIGRAGFLAQELSATEG